jgi:hypothetical protein
MLIHAGRKPFDVDQPLAPLPGIYLNRIHIVLFSL